MPESAYLSARIPYDELTSSFVRDEIRTGSFADRGYRSYVNCLVYAEWYATEGVHPNSTGLSAAGADLTNWRIATKYPEAYDAVRRDCNAPTRAETEFKSRVDEDPDERRRHARQYREQWRAVCDERTLETTTDTVTGTRLGRPQFRPFRFPAIPYHELESELVRAELRRGSFDDIAHREYINRLVYLEAWARDEYSLNSSGYPNPRKWRVAATEPTAFDAIRSEFGKDTREDLVPVSASPPNDEERLRYAKQWQRVQEQGTDGK